MGPWGVLEDSCGALGASWAHLRKCVFFLRKMRIFEGSRVVLGPLGGVLARLGGVFERLGGVLARLSVK